MSDKKTQITYEEFEKFFCEIFDLCDNNGILESADNFWKRMSKISLNSDELKKYFNSVIEKYQGDDNSDAMYSKKIQGFNTYEIALHIPKTNSHEDNLFFERDLHNVSEYKISNLSIEYSIFLMIKIMKNYNESSEKQKELLKKKLLLSEGLYFINYSNKRNLDLEKFLNVIFDYFSLKIKVIGEMTIDKWNELKKLFLFNCYYNSDISILERDLVKELMYNKPTIKKEISDNNISLPKARYIPELLDYYKRAVLSRDPFVQYISYYHILEYSYDTEFKNTMIDKLKKKLISPAFNYNDNKQIYDLAIMARSFEMDKTNSYPNEEQSLQFSIENHVNREELEQRLEVLDADINYYDKKESKHIKYLCDKNKENIHLDFSRDKKTEEYTQNDDEFKRHLCKRIYAVRNALVHSKNRPNESVYHAYEKEHEEQLRKEIPLIRAVAEQIIFSSAEPLSL